LHQSTTPQSFYRLQHPETQLYVRLTCVPAPRDQAPRITVRLTRRDRATRFPSHAAAVQCFARYIGAAPLEIVRSDA
jgi:hypothetical protein